MKFSGKELFEMGIPKPKIKFYIDKEFSSKEELLNSLNVKVDDGCYKKYTWVNWILDNFNHLPPNDFGTKMSNSELKRLFDKNSIRINNKFFKSTDECLEEEFPIYDFIWFPKGKRKTTWVNYEHVDTGDLNIQDYLWWNTIF